MSKKNITLLSGKDEITTGHEFVGLLFECAQDSRIIDAGSDVTLLNELVGDFNATKKHAYRLAKTILHGEPEFRGIRQLGIFEEVVILELQFILHSIHLYNFLRSNKIEHCHVTSRTRCIEGLIKILLKVQSPIVLTLAASQPNHSNWRSLSGRIVKRLKDGKFSIRSLKSEYHQVITWLDPFHQRDVLRGFTRAKSYVPGKIWFYSTAYTFTKIGLMYEPFFKDGFTYLIENPLTGGRALEEVERSYVNLYSFTNKGMGPSRKEILKARGIITRHISEVTLAGDDALARDLFLESDWLALFMKRHLPAGLFQSALFKYYIETVQPSAIVVGNPVFEAYLLHCAKEKGIPTILLQHGILGDYCQLLDPPADHYIVRGRFWQEFLSQAACKRSVILNPPQTLIPSKKSDANTESIKKHILFLTAPYPVFEFMHLVDLDDILVTLLQVASTENIKLIIRVHPLESIGYYQQIVTRLILEMTLRNIQVSYSQGPGLDLLVRESAVAVTYNSTVFLDCLRENIPLVSFGWHDFSYKKQIENLNIVHFAKSLEVLRSLVTDAVIGQLPPFAGSVDPFLAGTKREELEVFFAEIVSRNLSNE